MEKRNAWRAITVEKSHERPGRSMRESLHFLLSIPDRGMEKKERKERKDIERRKRIPEGREPRGIEGLAAAMERRTQSPKREAMTELRDRQAERLEKENSRGDAQGSVLSVRQ